ncbi:MAG: transglycosylase domain-containing protein [bacterium]
MLGLVVGFYLWAPHVLRQYHAVVANTANNTLIYDRYDRLIATVEGLEDRHTVSITRISPYLQKAVVAVEDRRFFAHRGLDPIRLAGAFWANLRSMAYYQGGSTITQQLVKLTLLSSERTLIRKAKELFMAVALEMEYPKLKLLEFYLNRVYLGHGLYGVEKAARTYFGKSAADLDLNEATFLAALIKKPEGYLEYPEGIADPGSPYLPLHLLDALRKRKRYLLAVLGNLGWVSEAEIREALSRQLLVHKPVPKDRIAPYFVQQILKELKKTLGVDRVAGRGFRVHTSLDPAQQNAAERQVARFASEQGQATQMALVALEPRSGFVRALVGGVDFSTSQFNRATLARRQPGSAFKPILYAAAVEKGYPPNATFLDAPIRYVWKNGEMKRSLVVEDEPFRPASLDEELDGGEFPDIYEPRNYNDRYGAAESRGLPPGERTMTMSRAIELSSNVIAVQVLDRLGVLPVMRLARRFNLTVRPEMGLCIALGCSETTLLELTAAYGAFANRGLRTAPAFIRKVTNLQGDVLYEHFPDPPEQVISEWTAFQMRRMLQGVMRRGTGWRARLGRPVGGKTGTNDGPRDAWFIGFTPELLAGVWIGNDDNRVMPGEAGGRTPARLWKAFMEEVLPPPGQASFAEPPGSYVVVRTCSVTGEVANPWCPAPHLYAYREEEAPLRVCTLHPWEIRRNGDLEAGNMSARQFGEQLEAAFGAPAAAGGVPRPSAGAAAQAGQTPPRRAGGPQRPQSPASATNGSAPAGTATR